ALAPAAEHLGDDLRVEDRAALIDTPHRVDEAVDLGDPVLEQVTDPLAAGGEQVDRVVLLDVLREDEDPGLRQLFADRRRGTQAVVGVVGGHADVDDRDIGLMGTDLAEKVLGVGGLADDLDPGLVEEARDPFPQEDRVLADHYSQGITALSLVPPPTGLATSRLPPSAATRSERPRRPLPSRVAPPGPSSPTSTTSEPSSS